MPFGSTVPVSNVALFVVWSATPVMTSGPLVGLVVGLPDVAPAAAARPFAPEPLFEPGDEPLPEELPGDELVDACSKSRFPARCRSPPW